MVHLHYPIRLRLLRGAEHLHALGPRATAEFLAEIDSRIGGLPAILTLLNDYQQRLSPHMLRGVSADRLPPRLLRVIPKEARP